VPLGSRRTPPYVHGEEAVELLLADFHDRLGEHHPGVVHQDVESAEPVEAGVEQPLNVADLAHVGLHSSGTSTSLF
jgi:hypothetical protein